MRPTHRHGDQRGRELGGQNTASARIRRSRSYIYVAPRHRRRVGQRAGLTVSRTQIVLAVLTCLSVGYALRLTREDRRTRNNVYVVGSMGIVAEKNSFAGLGMSVKEKG